MKDTFWSRIPWHPFALAAYPVLYLYAGNYEKLDPAVLVLPMAVVLLGVLLILLMLRAVSVDWRAAAAATSVFVLLFVTYQELFGLLKSAGFPQRRGNRELFLLIMEAVVFLGGALWIVRRRRLWPTVLLNTVAGVLIGMVGLFILVQILAQERPLPSLPAAETYSRGGRRPNIYYIIPDSYARSDVLQRLYGYDNSWFIRALEAEGFFVARESMSNYNQTLLSLGATLNFSYLDRFRQYKNGNNRGVIQHDVMYSRLVKLLKGQGYTFVLFPSGYAATEAKHPHVRMEPSFALSEFQNLLLANSPVPALLRRLPLSVMHHLQYSDHRRRIRYTLQHLELPVLAGPKFVLAHLLAPHPPFVFGPSGEPRNPEYNFDLQDGNKFVGAGREEYRIGYREQLQYLSGELLQAVRRIKRSDPGAVILLHADHGPGLKLIWEEPEKSDVLERHGILHAVYGPDEIKTRLYPGITPVNSIRVIINEIFSVPLPGLEDRAYFSTLLRPYDFVDVTERVRREAGNARDSYDFSISPHGSARKTPKS